MRVSIGDFKAHEYAGTYVPNAEGKRLQVSELSRRDLQQPRVFVSNATCKRLIGGESVYITSIDTSTI